MHMFVRACVCVCVYVSVSVCERVSLVVYEVRRGGKRKLEVRGWLFGGVGDEYCRMTYAWFRERMNDTVG